MNRLPNITKVTSLKYATGRQYRYKHRRRSIPPSPADRVIFINKGILIENIDMSVSMLLMYYLCMTAISILIINAKIMLHISYKYIIYLNS